PPPPPSCPTRRSSDLPFGLAIGQTGDTANWVGAVFNAYGAQLVDKDGNTTVKSDAVKQVLAWFQKLVPFLPPDVFAWDDSSNNRSEEHTSELQSLRHL